MATDPLTIDELLAKQADPDRLLVTIEAVQGDDERVKVTPYVPGFGCPCSRALNIEKNRIESIEPTDETHVCCGKKLFVVGIVFSDSILTDIFEQIRISIGSTSPPGLDQMDLSARQTESWSRRGLPPTQGQMPVHPSYMRSRMGQMWPRGRGELPLLADTGSDAFCFVSNMICEEACYNAYPWDLTETARCLCRCKNSYDACRGYFGPPLPC